VLALRGTIAGMPENISRMNISIFAFAVESVILQDIHKIQSGAFSE
jgi:hypothetical protein